MRFALIIVGSLTLHLILMSSIVATRSTVLPTKSGDFCIEIRSTSSSLPQQHRVAGAPMDRKQAEELRKHLVKTADSMRPYFDLARKAKEEFQKQVEKKLSQTQSDKGKGEDVVSTPASAASTASKVKEQGVRIEARFKGNKAPSYPQEAWNRGIEGEVLLKIRVLTTGKVEADLLKSSGYKSLDEAALRHARSLTADPALEGGIPVLAEYQLPVRYRLLGS